ncbi:N-methyltransferase gliN, partial [Frankliniella fusca]
RAIYQAMERLLRGQFFPGRQKGSFIVHGDDGYHYNVREVRGNRVRLQCRHYRRLALGCPGTASLSLDENSLHHLQPHNHFPDPLLSQDFEVRRQMIREAASNISGWKLRSILDEFKLRLTSLHLVFFCFRVGNPELASRFTMVRMHSALHAARSTNYPRIPNTLTYLGVLLGLPNVRPLCKTADDRDYIFQGVVGCIERKTVALIFVSGRMLRFLATLENIHADGTFKKRPRKSQVSQIFNLVTNYGGVVIAVARVLMMRRTQEAYLEVLNYLKTLAPTFAPRRIHCDFERGMMNAFIIAFPQSRIVGCLWHFAVAFSRQCRKLGLHPVAEENEQVHVFIRCLAGISLLPVNMMWTGVLQIWGEVVEAGFYQLFLPVFQYLETERKPRRHEMSCFDVPERTNNCSKHLVPFQRQGQRNRKVLPLNLVNQITEAWQMWFLNKDQIWNLVGGFVKLEFLAWADKIAVDNLRPVTHVRRWSAVLNDQRVSRASNLLRAGQSTPAWFLHQASFAILAAVDYGLHIHVDEDSDSE